MNNTILVTKAQVPTYLQSSPVLESWEDSDEPVLVNAAVLKMDTTIANLEDLDHLFATLRYWIVSDLPFSIFEYVLADSAGTCVQVLRKFERDLQSVACLLKLRRATAWRRWGMALKSGDLNCVRYFFENGLANVGTDFRSISAGAGSVPCLEYFRSKGCVWSPMACNAAAKNGHVNCLQYLYEQGFVCNANACVLAAQNGHLVCLKYLHEKGCPWTSAVCSAAAKHGQQECLMYLYEAGCPWTLDACTFAAEHGHLKCLKYLHEHGCEWDWKVCNASAGNGHADCLAYALRNRCSWHTTTACTAAANGHVHILRMLNLTNNATNWVERMVDEAASCGQIEVLKYLRAAGCAVGETATASATQRGQLACLKYLHETGCDWSVRTPKLAALFDHMDCLVYAAEHGCAMDSGVYKFAKTEKMKMYIKRLGYGP